MNYFNCKDTICAIATGGGISAIAVIRISGDKSIYIVNSIFSKDLDKANSHTIHFGSIIHNTDIIDKVLVSIFKSKNSFTGEESVEISCHGSNFIQNKIMHLLTEKGCRLSSPGEFTMRAFKNGKLDLLQAEAVADLIKSEGAAAHKIALQQLKGGVSNELQELRIKLIDFASLIELELDFSEEDVQFADRKQFQELLKEIKITLNRLIKSFSLGNSIKNGIHVAILGAPNVGKSTLLNSLLNEEKAIVSNVAGTTRDAIEDCLMINDFNFRFIDTAGIRSTKEEIERLGIKKSLEKAYQAKIILFVIDPTSNLEEQLLEFKKIKKEYDKKTMLVVNKSDLNQSLNINYPFILISAKNRTGIEDLKDYLLKFINISSISDNYNIITNIRHYEELQHTLNEIEHVINGINNDLSSDLLSSNIRKSLMHLGLITGDVTTNDLLENIFSKFCIGK